VRAHLRYAEEYAARGDSTLARREQELVGQTLTRVLARGTRDAGLLNGLAWTTALAGVNLDQSLAAATLAAEIEPRNPEILDTLAEVHFRRGEVDQAITAGERALALDPNSTYLQEQLVRFRAGRDRTQRGNQHESP
jgi:Flp pilus assembly protein TadD